MEKICNFCARKDQAVVELERESIEDGLPILCIAEKHFWFTNDELQSFNICDSCRNKLLEFHQFYCQVEQLYYVQSEVNEGKLEVGSFKTEQSEDVSLKQEIEHIDEDIVPDTNADYESSDTPGNGNQSSSDAENCEGQSGEKYLPRTITDDDIRMFCQMVCHICSEEFDYFADLKKHGIQVHDSKCYVHCCKNRFYAIFRLQEHILFHLKPDIYRCEKCGINLCSKRSLIRHQSSAAHLVRAEGKVIQCVICHKTFAKPYSLSVHMKRHTH